MAKSRQVRGAADHPHRWRVSVQPRPCPSLAAAGVLWKIRADALGGPPAGSAGQETHFRFVLHPRSNCGAVPGDGKKIDAHGHEIGFHGFDHEEHMYTDRPREEWMQVIERAQETFQRLIGRKAVGYVATSSDFQMDAPQIWYEAFGFKYSSSMRGMTGPTARYSTDGSPTSLRSPPDGSWMTIPSLSTASIRRSRKDRAGSPATGACCPIGNTSLTAITAREGA